MALAAATASVRDGSCAPRFAARPKVSRSAASVRQESLAKGFEAFVLRQQEDIIQAAEQLESEFGHEGGGFGRDRWERPHGAGYGITRVLEGGKVLEKAAVNVSVVQGKLSEARAAALSERGNLGILGGGGQQYSAVALSLVFHTANPFVPTLRGDVRFFEVEGLAPWVGGGCDLTPNYIEYEHPDTDEVVDLQVDFVNFHRSWKTLCDNYRVGAYEEFKATCDTYFYIPCRNEHRGIGGIFFDDLTCEAMDFDAISFAEECGANILPSWKAIARRRGHLPFTAAHRRWQELRRGRYIEFNLLYDRGVKFGLDGGRVESVMVSAPPAVAWHYQPKLGLAEERMLAVLHHPVGWAASSSNSVAQL